MLHCHRHISSLLRLSPHPFSSNTLSAISYSHHRLYYHAQSSSTPLPSNTNTTIVDTLDLLLRQCTTSHHTKQIHTQIIITGSHKFGFLSARLISLYSQFSLPDQAQQVFYIIPIESKSNILLWNSILRANISHGLFEQVIKLYFQLRTLCNILPDGFTYPLVIRACASLGNLELSKIVHNHVMVSGLGSHLHVGNELVRMYGKLGWTDYAVKVFDKMPYRTHISWNTMVSVFSENYDYKGAIGIFERMEVEGLEPNLVTWTSLLSAHARCGQHERAVDLFVEMRRKGNGANAEAVAVMVSVCADSNAFSVGKGVHGYVVTCGFEDFVFVKNSLIRIYGKHGTAEDAMWLFSEMKVKNLVSWNALISSFAEAGLSDKALEVFSQLEKLEDPTMRPNVISWSAIIGAASLRKGQEEKCMEIFRKMLIAGVSPNSVTIATLLSVCAELAALDLGREIHGHAIKAFIGKNILVVNGLVNMYAKCGNVEQGRLVFDKSEAKDLISWNSLIAGYGMHGFGENALTTFNEMIKAGLKPDGITFVALLSGCSHTGLICEGRKLFDQMSNEFSIQPQIEHYACMVDLLARAGLFQEAIDIVKMMPMKPNTCVWGALLNSSRIHKNTQVAEEVASHIFSNESDTTGSYMVLSNLYAVSGRWEDSAKVRGSAKERSPKKIPGQSWIEVKKKMYIFTSGNCITSQSGMQQVGNVFLEDLDSRMKAEGYKPDISFVLQDVDEEEKKQILRGHSEKLAIAFAHVNIPPNMPIRVIKNLRVCGDCHNWTKIFSKVMARQVIVRDGRRFHHFDDGACSCKDYW